MGFFLKTPVSVVFRPRNYVFGAGKSCRAFFRPILPHRRPFPRGELGKSRFWGVRPLWEGPAAWEKLNIFTNFLVIIQHRMEFFHVVFLHFIF